MLLTGAVRGGVVPSFLSADEDRGAREDGVRAGAVIEGETSVSLPPHLPANHLLVRPGTVSPVTDRDLGEVPGVALAVDQAHPPPPVASVTAVLVDRATVLPNLVGINPTIGNARQVIRVTATHSCNTMFYDISMTEI